MRNLQITLWAMLSAIILVVSACAPAGTQSMPTPTPDPDTVAYTEYRKPIITYRNDEARHAG